MPAKREVVQQLRDDIEMYRVSYREADGIIRDRDALHAIRCLEVALLVVRERKFPKGT